MTCHTCGGIVEPNLFGFVNCDFCRDKHRDRKGRQRAARRKDS